MTIDVKAGERKRILHRFSNAMQATYRFAAEPAGSGELSGSVEVEGSRWIFRKPAVIQPLQRDNSVEKGMWDSRYGVYVIPDNDVTITMKNSDYPKLRLSILIAMVIVGAAPGIVVISLN